MNQGQGMPQIQEITPALVKEHADAILRHRLETADSRRTLDNMDKQREYGLKVEDGRIKKDTNAMHREHYQRADATQELYRQNQAPLLQAQARYYDRMPNTSGGASEQPLSKEEQATLMALQTKYAEAAEGSPEQRNIAKQYQLAQNAMMLNRGRAPNLPAGMVTTPKPQRQFDPEVIKAAATELQNIPAMTPKIESAFRQKWGPVADHILGADSMLQAAGAAYGSAGKPTPPSVQGGTSFSAGHSSQGSNQGRVGQNSELADIQMRLAQPGISDATKYELQMRQNAILYPDRRGFSPLYKPQL
jgi:hypothetical protein